MEKMKKLTKAEKFAMLKAIPEVAENEVLVDFIDHELELLNRKNSGEKKPTKGQIANAELSVRLLEDMESGHAYSVTDMSKTLPAVMGMSSQKITALLRSLRANGSVTQEMVKGHSLYTKVEE